MADAMPPPIPLLVQGALSREQQVHIPKSSQLIIEAPFSAFLIPQPLEVAICQLLPSRSNGGVAIMSLCDSQMQRPTL